MRQKIYLGAVVLVALALSACTPSRQPVYYPQEPAPQQKTTSQPATTKKSSPAPKETTVKKSSRPAIVDTWISQAKTQLNQNKPAQAFSTLERALSVDGQDPVIWHYMAVARQMQGQHKQAESLARKSNSLAKGQNSLVKKNNDIIANAR